MKRIESLTYVVHIYVGDNGFGPERICQVYCDEVGLCVTIEPVSYVFTGGRYKGHRIGLINYPPYSAEPRVIWNKAEALAKLLIKGLAQESATLVATDKTVTLTNRPEHAPVPATDEVGR